MPLFLYSPYCNFWWKNEISEKNRFLLRKPNSDQTSIFYRKTNFQTKIDFFCENQILIENVFVLSKTKFQSKINFLSKNEILNVCRKLNVGQNLFFSRKTKQWYNKNLIFCHYFSTLHTVIPYLL